MLRNLLAALTVTALSAGAASASPVTITDQYYVTSAIGTNNSADHSLWISGGLGEGIGTDFDFDPAGLFTLFSDGLATLTGVVVSQNDAGAWFDLSFNYDSVFSITPAFKSENGSVSTPDTFYRDLEGGTLIGGGILAGLDISVTRAPVYGPYATQIGAGTANNNGANNKNNNFGLANWFKISIDSATCSICSNSEIAALVNYGGQGDINVDLTPVPVPAAGLLLVGALGALGFLRRRKPKAA